MIRASEACAQIREVALGRTLGSESVPLSELAGRRLAEDLLSQECVPHWDNSAMDGFAVCADWTQSATATNGVRLPVSASIVAGDSGSLQDRPGERFAVEIMTGAPLPHGPWDSIVKIEEVQVLKGVDGAPSEIVISKPAKKGDFVRYQGEDFAIGQLVASKGMLVTPDFILAFAALGIHRAQVFRKPRVAVLSTGRELVNAHEPLLRPGMIRNSTAPYLEAALPALGAEYKWYGTIEDDPEAFKRALMVILADSPDVVLTTGAVSMGKHDFVREALESMGARTHFHKMAIRPGKPLLFSEFQNGPVIFGVPGNPISTAVGLRFFVTPYLRALARLEKERPIRAKLFKNAPKPEGLRCYFKARLDLTESGSWVEALAGQGSALLGPLLQANAWVEFPEEGSQMSQGEWVDVHPLFPSDKPWVFSSHSNDSSMMDPKLTPREIPVQKGCC